MHASLGMKTAATASDVNRLLGDVDPIVVERILAIGASADEIGEALLEVEEERGFGEEPHHPSSPAVLEVKAVLEELAVLEGDVEDEDVDYAPV